jgi:uncharacterized protein (TIGR00369 family)
MGRDRRRPPAARRGTPPYGEIMANRWFDRLARDYVRGFPRHCGFVVDRVDLGIFETRLPVERRHLQQDGFVHAGVIATMADHTSGYAAFTTVDPSRRILTIEFKINFFRPATGDTLWCRARVLEGGKTVIVAESEVYAGTADAQKRVSKATVTLMAVAASTLAR